MECYTRTRNQSRETNHMTILPVYSPASGLAYVVYIDNSNVGYAFNRHAPFRWVVSNAHITRVTR